MEDNDDSSSDTSSSTADTCPETPSTPISDYGEYPDRLCKRFAATVEDDTSSQGHQCGFTEDNKPASDTFHRRPTPAGRDTPPASSGNSFEATQRAHDNPSIPYLDTFASKLPTAPSSITSSPKLRPTVHFSDRAPPKLHQQPSSRSSTTSSAGQSPELSVIDRQWGKLFTGVGEPTTRLLQVLRGLANYIVRTAVS